MPLQTFNYRASSASELTEKPRVVSAKFGDGYEQRSPDGINTILETWVLKFDRSGADIDAIRAFLKARGGYQAFQWANPYNVTNAYICREWKIVKEIGKSVLTCTFEQVPEL